MDEGLTGYIDIHPMAEGPTKWPRVPPIFLVRSFFRAFSYLHPSLVDGKLKLLWDFHSHPKSKTRAPWWASPAYSPLPNIRPGPNYRLVGNEVSELIRDQDLFTNHLGWFPKFKLVTITFNCRPLGIICKFWLMTIIFCQILIRR